MQKQNAQWGRPHTRTVANLAMFATVLIWGRPHMRSEIEAIVLIWGRRKTCQVTPSWNYSNGFLGYIMCISNVSRFRNNDLLEKIVHSKSVQQVLVRQGQKPENSTFSTGFSGKLGRVYQKYIIPISKGVFQDPFSIKSLFSNHNPKAHGLEI